MRLSRRFDAQVDELEADQPRGMIRAPVCSEPYLLVLPIVKRRNSKRVDAVQNACIQASCSRI
jgi:c-di-GMP-binding flagellar brake protein YcgR